MYCVYKYTYKNQQNRTHLADACLLILVSVYCCFYIQFLYIYIYIYCVRNIPDYFVLFYTVVYNCRVLYFIFYIEKCLLLTIYSLSIYNLLCTFCLDYSRLFVADGAHPVGAASGAFRQIIFATSLADALSARFAQGATIDDATETGATPGAAPAVVVSVSVVGRMIQSGSRYLILSDGHLQGAFLSQKLQFRL